MIPSLPVSRYKRNIENMQCLLCYLESQRWRLSESNCVLSIYRLHNSLGSLSLSLLDLVADTFVCTETQQLHIVIKLPVKQSQLTNSFVQLSFPICFTARSASARTVRIASLNSLPGHKPRNSERLPQKKIQLCTISKLKCLKLASSEDVIHCIRAAAEYFYLHPNTWKAAW